MEAKIINLFSLLLSYLYFKFLQAARVGGTTCKKGIGYYQNLRSF